MDGLVQGILQASEGSCTLIHWRCLGGCHHVRSRSENGDWGVLQILTLKKQENSWSQRHWPKCVAPENIHTPATKEGISCKSPLPSRDFHFVEHKNNPTTLLRLPYHLQKIVLARKCVEVICYLVCLWLVALGLLWLVPLWLNACVRVRVRVRVRFNAPINVKSAAGGAGAQAGFDIF